MEETQKNMQGKPAPSPMSYVFNAAFASIENQRKRQLEEIQKQQEREQQTLLEGGWIKRKRNNESAWKSMPWYVYVIMAVFTILMVFFIFLQKNRYVYIFDYRFTYLNDNVFISLCCFYVFCLCIFIKFLIDPYVSGRDFYVRSIHANNNRPPFLGIGNGIGFGLYGDYRRVGGTKVSYYCLSFFVPILPLGCYRVKEGTTKHIFGRGYSTGYSIYCSERWNILEVIDLYLLFIAGAALGGCILYFLFYLFP